MSRKFVTLWPVVSMLAVGLVVASCSSKSPTTPSSSSSSTTPAPSNSGGVGRITISVNPNPVPFSGKPITDVSGCANRNNTWFYDQILQETGGAPVTFNSEIDMFDGSVVNNKTSLSISVPANGKTTLSQRWCSSESKSHTAQSTFSGVDSKGNALTVNGPQINLMAAPK